MSRYANEDYKISISYPPEWQVSEQGLASYQIVRFIAPEVEKEETSTSIVIFTPAELTVAIQPLSGNKTVDQFIKEFLNSTYSSPTEYRVIETSDARLLNMPAKKIVMYEYGVDSSKVMRLVTLSDNTAYMIKYTAEPGSFDEYLPVAQSMADSLQLLNSTNSFANSNITSSSDPVLDSASLTDLPSQNADNNMALPETLIVKDDMHGDNRLALRSTVNGSQATVADLSSSRAGELYDWNPVVTFGFEERAKVGLLNINQLLIGPIKSYESKEDILEQAVYYQNIPINEEVVMPVDSKGLNYVIASVMFSNGNSGIYSSVVNVDASGTKSAADDYLDYRIDQGEAFNILDDTNIEDVENSPVFLAISSQVICSELKENGFDVCGSNTETIGDDTITISSESDNSDESDNGNNDEDNEDDNDD